ncbi:hypothetical protein ACFL2Z_00595, partial [Candidatus Eisenbacteria bacterium]
ETHLKRISKGQAPRKPDGHRVEPAVSDEQKEDIDSAGYKCTDSIRIPGTQPDGRDVVFVNQDVIPVAPSHLVFLLRLAGELVRCRGGWVKRQQLIDEGVVTADGYNQRISEVRKAIGPYLAKHNPRGFIENRSKEYRISTHPDFVTYDKARLLKHPENTIRKLARKLPR